MISPWGRALLTGKRMKCPEHGWMLHTHGFDGWTCRWCRYGPGLGLTQAAQALAVDAARMERKNGGKP